MSSGQPRLTLASTIEDIDRRLATRRMGVDRKGPPAEEVLASAFDIRNVAGLLHHYPRRYIDRAHVQRIGRIEVGVPATVIGHVRSVSYRVTRTHKKLVTVTIADGSGTLALTFFGQPWLRTTYRKGMEVAASGIGHRYGRTLQLQQQEVEILRTDEQDLIHTGRLTPVHPASEGVSARTIRELVYRALALLPPLPDPLPEDVVTGERLGSYDRALRDIHFPADDGALGAAIERLKFDELFTLELGVAFRKHRIATEEAGIAHAVEGPLSSALREGLPFAATAAQERAMAALDTAMARPEPMNVLLQGDVGSGKTLVALHACLVAIQSGHQAAFMAPTEVLANQHERSAAALLGPIGGVRYLDRSVAPTAQASLLDAAPDTPPPVLTWALLTSAVPAKDRSRILDGAAAGSVDLLIGTHALVQEGVSFADLSLAVVDEQHRFGLHQRMALKGKGGEADVLIMTATPIPRSLALTYYGDLDVTILDEMPVGRLPIRTVAARTGAERAAAYRLVHEEARAGRQAFVVCAAIDEANKTQVKAAEAEAGRLAAEVFPDLRVALLHGKMRPKDKQDVMDRFRVGETDVLITTTVIEVGVDVPNATIMLVENAERFGLAQLHQLRGRIGRGSHPATCVLFDEAEGDNAIARARIDAMVATTDGFALADEDLRLRGEGTLFDTRQAGMPDLRLARLAEDADLVRRARERAFALVASDPHLVAHPELLEELRARFERSIDWLFRS